MVRSVVHLPVSLPRLLLAAGAFLLALSPVEWLVNSWRDPSYDSSGAYSFLITLALVVWSVTSRKITCRPIHVKMAITLLAATAMLRLLGQLLAVNVIGALALVVDVYAIAYLAALHLRARPVSPGWLALCFAFSLPLERILQRTIGFGLQQLSADTACGILGGMFEHVTCSGVRILIEGQDVLVDLPCSGARGALLLLFFFSLCAAICRPRVSHAIAGIGVTLFTALIGNSIRITALAIGIAYPQWLGGIEVMAQPWHDAIGLATLGVQCMPIIYWARKTHTPVHRLHPILDQIRWRVPHAVNIQSWWWSASPHRQRRYDPLLPALAFLMAAIFITGLPGMPVDIIRKNLPIELPTNMDNETARPLPLLPAEKNYFVQYGGSAAKAAYGEHSLLLVRTSAPLRHLHAPDECMRGLGMKVAYQGMRYQPLPTAIYKATGSDGHAYRVEVSFISEDGYITTNVAEAVWRWLQNPGRSWLALQRITSWDVSVESSLRFERAVMAALDINPSSAPSQLATFNPR